MASSLWAHICATKALRGGSGHTPIFCLETEPQGFNFRPIRMAATDYEAVGASDGLDSSESARSWEARGRHWVFQDGFQGVRVIVNPK